MLAALRQLMFPKEFRIDPPVWPSKMQVILEEIKGLLESETTAVDYNKRIEKNDNEIIHFFSDIGTGLWRISRQLMLAEAKEPPEHLRRINRSFESTWDAFIQAGFEIKDHTGDIVIGGEAMHIISFQPMPGIIKDQVIETLRPTIFYKGKMVQAGEVIVGMPEQEEVV